MLVFLPRLVGRIRNSDRDVVLSNTVLAMASVTVLPEIKIMAKPFRILRSK